MDENTLWIPISKVPENQRDGLRADMAARRVRYRYLDAASFKAASSEEQPSPPRKYVESDPGAAFWHCANINWTWSTAVAGPLAICGLEVRLDDESPVAEKAPYAANREWKEFALKEFERLRASGGITKRTTLESVARQIATWLETTHKISRSWQSVQGVLPSRRSWPAAS
jgi:hypothetical protein